jgi:hypothetical protein
MKLIFETPTLVDAIRRAALVAPTRGDAFDKAAGIVLDINPGGSPECLIKATDTVLYYTEAISPLRIEDGTAPARWRLPSALFASFVGKLPIGSGSQVTMDVPHEKYQMSITSKRLKAQINLIRDLFYPEWGLFDAAQLEPIPELGAVMKQTLWANSGAVPKFDGIGVGPNFIGCTDGYRFAVLKHSTGIDKRFLVPSKVLPQVLPIGGEIKVGLEGNNFLLMPNDWTQMQTAIIEDFPDMLQVMEKITFKYETQFNKSEVLPMINQALDFKGGDRQGTVNLILGRGEVAVFVDNAADAGLFRNVCDAWGSAETHPRLTIKFKPENLRDAIQNFPRETVIMRYNAPDAARKNIYFTDDELYHSMVMPLRDIPKQEEAAA